MNEILGFLFGQPGEIYQPQSLLPIAFCGFEQLILTEIQAYTNQEFSSQTQVFQAFHHTGVFMKSQILTVALPSSSFLTSGAFADEEYVEVTAPNECCQTPMPGTLGLIASMAGAPSASVAAGGLRAAALKAAQNRAAEQRAEQKQEQKTEQEKQTQYNDAIQTKDPAKQTNVWDFLSTLVNQAFDGGYQKMSKSTTKNEDGTITETETRECKAGGPMNKNNVPCTLHQFEVFTDPVDGMTKWAYTISVIEPKYNPKHYDADASGYYPSVIGNQTFSIVFETKEDLLWQMRKIGGR